MGISCVISPYSCVCVCHQCNGWWELLSEVKCNSSVVQESKWWAGDLWWWVNGSSWSDSWQIQGMCVCVLVLSISICLSRNYTCTGSKIPFCYTSQIAGKFVSGIKSLTDIQNVVWGTQHQVVASICIFYSYDIYMDVVSVLAFSCCATIQCL